MRPPRQLHIVLLVGVLTASWSVLGGTALAADQGGFNVLPMRYDLEISAGSSKTKYITVTNTQGKTIKVNVGVEDFQGSSSDPYAAPVLMGGQVDSPISAADWIKTGVGSFTLKAGESRNVKTITKVPNGATGGHYAAVTLSTTPQTVSDELNAVSRIAVLYFINAGGASPPEIVFEDIYVDSSTGETVVEFDNPGNSSVDPDNPNLTYDPVGPGSKETVSGTCTETLPGAKGQCRFAGPSDDAPYLVYNGEVELSNGGRTFTQSMPPRVAGGFKSLLLPLTGIGLFIGYFFFLRKRSDEEEEDDLALGL